MSAGLGRPSPRTVLVPARRVLRRKRLKHHAEMNPVRRQKRLVARRFQATVAERQTVTMYHGDTVDARQFLRARCADVIVADAPYGISWNTHVARREDAEAVLADNGLSVVEYPDLSHRVDQAILRDVVVARK